MLVILCLSDELRVATLRSAALAFCGGKFTMLPKEEAGAFMQNHTELALEVRFCVFAKVGGAGPVFLGASRLGECARESPVPPVLLAHGFLLPTLRSL